MRLLLLVAVAVGAWLLLRRRTADERRVVVAWEDGAELELRTGSDDRERMVAIAREALP
jgi:hypothetical protein